MKKLLAALMTSAVLAAVPAHAVVLNNGPGDGTVSLTVNGTGTFGSATTGSGGDVAIYDPVGATPPPASTTFYSNVFLRVGAQTGARTDLSTVASTAGAASATSATSTFATSGLNFVLNQSLSALFDNTNARTGSLLTQAYSFTNTTGSALTVELTRYIDGDLLFDGSLTDGGGRLTLNGMEVLFETDAAIGSADSNTFLGIFNDGGTSTGYEVNSFSGLYNRTAAGTALANVIAGDGADADQFIDNGAGYDVTLALGRLFTIGAGQTATFTTGTIFGSGAPDRVVVPPMGGVPEPATWGMMILGFGLVGAAARRRRVVRSAA